MKTAGITLFVFCIALIAASSGHGAAHEIIELTAAKPQSSATQTVVPDLASPNRWRTTPDGKIIVTPDNFIRAESNLYMAGQVQDGAFGKFKHTREAAPVDRQLIVRLNRDTIYSSAIFDLD